MDKAEAVAVLERSIASIENLHAELRGKFGSTVDVATLKTAVMIIRKPEYEALKLALAALKLSAQ